MNGTLETDALPGQLTEFHDAAKVLNASELNRTDAKILVVDDEADVVRALSMRLKSAGYDVVTATDGIAANQAAIAEKPDLILLDIGMPGRDGHTVALKLTDSLKTLFIPVIFLTAKVSMNDKYRAMDLGVVDYITKPYTSERLLAAVSRALNGPGTLGKFLGTVKD